MTTAGLAGVAALADAISEATVVSSTRGIEHANAPFERLTGKRADAVHGQALTALAAPGDAARLDAAVALASESAPTPLVAVSLLDAAARPILTAHASRMVVFASERFLLSTFTPIDDIRSIVNTLGAAEHRYRRLFEDETCGRFVATDDWRLLDVNSWLALLLTGRPEAAACIGRSLRDFATDTLALQKLLAVAGAEGSAGPVDLRLRSDGGEQFEVSCRIAAELASSGSSARIHGQVVDVTDERRLQIRSSGAARMEVVGRLAGGMAHDFNNLLTVIGGNADRLQDQLPDGHPLATPVAAIRESTARASALTRQLLAFSRRQLFQLRPIALDALLIDMEPLLVGILGDAIALRIQAAPELPTISADARQIEDVVVAMSINAREAMAAGGTFTIALDPFTVDASVLKERAWLRPGSYARLVASDTGAGMDPLTRAHAFQPFFTTKGIGAGHGLGLAMVYGIVKQSHGFVWVESELGRGATFTLLFPALESAALQSSAPARAERAETILLVDPDASLRELVRGALRRRGYTVLDAGSAAEALDLFAAYPSRIHLLVSDVGCTVDNAPLDTRLRAIDPLLQSVMMLEPEEADRPRRRVLPTTPVIQKPFTLQALAERVGDVLRSGEGRG